MRSARATRKLCVPASTAPASHMAEWFSSNVTKLLQ